MKYQHGQYLELHGDDDDMPEYVRGHVTVEEAKAAIAKWGEHPVEDIIDVRHLWARWHPVRGGDYDAEFNLVPCPARGAFSVSEVVRARAACDTTKGGANG